LEKEEQKGETEIEEATQDSIIHGDGMRAFIYKPDLERGKANFPPISLCAVEVFNGNRFLFFKFHFLTSFVFF